WSGSGKTTLIEQVIPRFVRAGLKVSLIKHAHHRFDVDHPGKDSFRHRAAGCSEVLVTSRQRWALMHEARDEAGPTLEEQIARMSPCDLLLIEGYKHYPLPKLEIFRVANGKPPLYPQDEHIVALATDTPVPCALPQFGLDDYDGIAAFVLATLELKR
ncbi:MAG: molybdopterin-guanine dinucleotide biosynthesis protein B, partial [Pseudomonadota bacterium]